ncbi:MAG: hypothetical protein IAE94_12200 [Chthoniobacterales bacterium]|nr:hypothetical protein [Chthoniobacterales bacterium]
MRTMGSLLSFVAASVCSAIVLAFPCGGISPPVAIAAFAIGFVTAFAAWRGIPAGKEPAVNAWDVLLWVVFALAALRAFLWILYPAGEEWRVLSPNNLGDISLHLHMIRYLAGGVDFWPASPILAGVPLIYPLGIDLFNALLLCVGMPVERGLIWVGLLGAFLTGWSLWRWGGAFALAALLFNGGLAGFLIFQTGSIQDFQADLPWKNFFLTMLVTQRGLLHALPSGLFLLCVWREDFFRTGSGVPRWVAFLLYVTMPIFSAHAFVFLSLILAGAFVVNPKKRKILLGFVACAILPATTAMFFVTGHFSIASGLRWLPGWMQGSEMWLAYVRTSGAAWLENSKWFFWLWNFGVSLPLLCLLGWKIVKTRDREALCFAGTGLVVFLICCFVSLAPWEWDNTKLFLWAWLACAPFLWQMLSTLSLPLRGLLCLLLFFSGAVSLVGGLDGRHGYKLTTRQELDTTAALLKDVPFEDRIVISPDYNHPVMLLGRPVFCGYAGHLWSHGLDYRDKWQLLENILKKKPGWQEVLKTIDAQWLFLRTPRPVLQEIRRNPPPHSGAKAAESPDYSPRSSPTM